MTRATVIIGANHGDEGKGLMTDHLAASSPGPAIVLRFNGGAQAGHTVVTPSGDHHVFSHFGSGSLAGADSYLGPDFVSHPMLFLDEWRRLTALGARPRLAADPEGLLTTPFDMMINQALEVARGDARHGSCGIGFGETVERAEVAGLPLRLRDLDRPRWLRAQLETIQHDYAPARLATLGIDEHPEVSRFPFRDTQLIDRFLEDCAAFRARIQLSPPDALDSRRPLIFEGAQGLMLDQELGAFPHVTRSFTGLRNVMPLAERMGLTHLDTIYVSRIYDTRHGAGPMAHELPGTPFAGVRDATNQPNPYQGQLRFGWLDVARLRQVVDRDLAAATIPAGLTLSRGLALTCLDQASGPVTFMDGTGGGDGGRQTLPVDAFAHHVRQRLGAETLVTSHGPSRRTVMPDDRRAGVRAGVRAGKAQAA